MEIPLTEMERLEKEPWKVGEEQLWGGGWKSRVQPEGMFNS